MRTIGMFAPDLQGGGAERVTVRLANAFASRNYGVDLMLQRAVGPNLRLLDPNVHVTALNTPWRNSISSLNAHMRLRRPDIVLAAFDEWCLFPLMACKMSGIPVIAAIHTDITVRLADEPWQHRCIRWGARLSLRHANAIVTVAPRMIADLMKWAAIPSSKLHVVPNPVISRDLFFAASEPPDHPWLDAAEPPVLVAVGRLAPVKRFDLLIRAFARLRQYIPARLVIVGEGPERGALAHLARALGVERDVSLAGWRDNPYAIMSRARAVVLSSDLEGLPSVIIEALALGTPVIATDCSSGTREALRGGELGRLVPPGSVDALADAMYTALTDSGPAPAGARSSVLARYGVDGAVGHYEQLLIRTLEEDTHRRRR